jgi:hypothetical protein
MAVTEGSISVAEAAGKPLDTAIVTTGVGPVHREGVFLGDPETAGARTRVTNAAPLAGDYGAAARIGDGHDVAKGATSDAAAPSGNGSQIALLKAIRDILKGPSAAVVTRPSVGAGSTQILAANTARKRVVVTNEHATQDLYIKHGAGASTTSYTWVAQSAGGVVVIPMPAYTGAIEAIYSGGGTQVCEVTEET